MTKREIIALINANIIIRENKKILSLTHMERFESISIDEENWFLDIDDLKEEFDILKKEVKEKLKETENSKELIKNAQCDHHIRLNHYGTFGSHSTCVLCSRSFSSNNVVNWEYSINRNKYCVMLPAKYQDLEDCDYIESGYTNTELYKIILDILKDKKDEDEIDLVSEFKKLELRNPRINEEKKVNEYFILIIGGTNKEFIDSESYVTSKFSSIAPLFVQYFSTLLNTKIRLLDTEQTINSQEFNNMFKDRNYNLSFVKYSTLEELNELLKKDKSIPYKLIIDLSSLYTYNFSTNPIAKEKTQIQIEQFFPKSEVIRLENDSIKKSELDSTCLSLKRLLKK